MIPRTPRPASGRMAGLFDQARRTLRSMTLMEWIVVLAILGILITVATHPRAILYRGYFYYDEDIDDLRHRVERLEKNK